MDPAFATVLAATITAVAGLIGLALKQVITLRKENKADHGAVMDKLNEVQQGVQHVSERLDDHIEWHLK